MLLPSGSTAGLLVVTIESTWCTFFWVVSSVKPWRLSLSMSGEFQAMLGHEHGDYNGAGIQTEANSLLHAGYPCRNA